MTASWVDQTWLAIDTETTGIDVFSDRIVEVAAVEIHPDGTSGTTYRTIVNPGIDIPDGAAAIHGITTARARDEGIGPATAIAEVAQRVFAHGHQPVVMFNARFDWPLLICEAERHNVDFPVFAPVLDPFLVDRMLDQYRRGSRKLVAVAQHYAVELDEVDAHGALADATAAALVMRAIIARYPKVADHTLASVYLRQVRGHERWRENFVDWKHRNGEPDFDEPPGWPIPALVKGGLPVVDQVAASQEPEALSAGATDVAPVGVASPPPTSAAPAQDPPPAHGGDDRVGEEATAAGPAATSPTPVHEYAITERDVARLAGEVFRADYDAAPRGQKTKVQDRLRHAVIYAQTAGSKCSLKGLGGRTLYQVHQRLTDIAEGRMSYQPDDDGVTFLIAGASHPVRVEWAQLETPGAAA